MKKKIGRAPRAARSAAQIPTCRKRPDAIKLLEHVRGGFRNLFDVYFHVMLVFLSVINRCPPIPHFKMWISRVFIYAQGVCISSPGAPGDRKPYSLGVDKDPPLWTSRTHRPSIARHGSSMPKMFWPNGVTKVHGFYRKVIAYKNPWPFPKIPMISGSKMNKKH